MARLARADVFHPAEVSVFHCINRCVRRCFLCGDDPLTGVNYDHRKAWLEERLRFLAGQFGIDVLGFAIMSNHFHLVLWPRGDGDLSRWMQWLLTSQVRRYHRHYHGSGHVWQGRFKAFPIQEDEHPWIVLRYVERNALRAELVRRAEDWTWSSLAASRNRVELPWLHPGPSPRPRNWLQWVNQALTDAELERLRRAAAGAIQNADFVEDEMSDQVDEESDAVASRRYRMTGRIQQASAVVE